MKRIGTCFQCEAQAKGSTEPMHIFIFIYTIFHARKNTVTMVVVLAVVRPPPVRVYHIFKALLAKEADRAFFIVNQSKN